MRIISEQEVCKLVPAARIGKTFDFRVRQAMPSKTSDARSAYVSCMYSNGSEGTAFFSVGLSVSYFRGADMHQNVRTYQVRSGNVGHRFRGFPILQCTTRTPNWSRVALPSRGAFCTRSINSLTAVDS